MLKSTVKINCRPYNGNSRTKAFIDLTLDDTLVIKGLTLVEWGNKLFLSFPSKKGSDNNFHDTTYILDKEYKKLLEDACIKKYNEAVNKSDNSGEAHFS
jgi:stage V sporulation protein G